jgi:hypothetical protein
MCFYNVSAPAFAGLGWLAYVNATYWRLWFAWASRNGIFWQ